MYFKAIYYLKLKLLIPVVKDVLNLSQKTIHEIERMALYLSIIHSVHWLSSEKADIAALKVND